MLARHIPAQQDHPTIMLPKNALDFSGKIALLSCDGLAAMV